ncbi:TonB-dependent receptor [Rhodocytophaga aerolata]|uniref:TonB-dependent receptor n=1 Tax=Rhodocytophaga aerolata TaxID=455078 RepID=A0ABT8RAS6_9BACT|nr:TonB-dependent receptor [Rhodocytophaga aerolata]MDO1449182.1 TonB-dependent receptor [Rhodocytophaga aerolata]
MSRTAGLLVFLCCVSCLATAQSILVLDKVSLQPIENVMIYTQATNNYVNTNIQGIADISLFNDSPKILISHPAYQLQTISYQELAEAKFRVLITEKIYNLDEIVISASKFEEKKSDLLGQVQVLKAREIAFMNSQTSAEVLQNSGNILVQKSQQGGGSPIIRGFEANKVLLVVDGVRMNNAIYRGGHLQNVITLDNAMLDRIEVIFGPGSVVYGSDALGGVMHFVTKSPSLKIDSATNAVSGNAFIRYATAAREKTAHADVNIGFKKWAFLSAITASDFDDLRQGTIRRHGYEDWGKRTFKVKTIDGQDQTLPLKDVNIQSPSGYTQLDLMQKVVYRPKEFISHQLNIQYSTSSDIPRYDRLTLLDDRSNPRFAEWYYGPQKRLFGSYQLELKATKGLYNKARFVAAYQNIEESRMDRRFENPVKNHRIENLDIYTLNIDLNRNIASHEIRYGLEATDNQVKSRAFAYHQQRGEYSSLDTRYPDGGSFMRTLAAYLTHTWEISPKVIFSEGIRYTGVNLVAKFNNKEFFSFLMDEVNQQYGALNGNIGLLFKTKGWRLSSVASSGFRAPNIDDLSKVFESVPGQVIVPNPGIKPEYTYNGEVGIGKEIAGKIQVAATGYYTWYTNAITTQPTTFNGSSTLLYDGQVSRVTRNVNAGQAFIYGGNVSISAQLNAHFSLQSTLNYTHGRIRTDSTNYPLDHIPPLFGKTSISFTSKQFRAEFYSLYNGWKHLKDYNIVGEDNLAYATPEGTPAWYTLNMRTGYQFNQKLQLQAALENILDYNYRVFASGISAPSRNLILTLRINL